MKYTYLLFATAATAFFAMFLHMRLEHRVASGEKFRVIGIEYQCLIVDVPSDTMDKP